MLYREQLETNDWIKLSSKILKRDKYTCRMCGRKASVLNVHHAIYLKGKMAWEYPEDMLYTLCRDCHRAMHNLKPNIKYPEPKDNISLTTKESFGIYNDSVPLLLDLKPNEISLILELLKLMDENNSVILTYTDMVATALSVKQTYSTIYKAMNNLILKNFVYENGDEYILNYDMFYKC